jgi:LacI family transcriptional regulator
MGVATIFDVAQRAGVGTVSRVLNQSPQISDATRARALEAIRELEYIPSSVARSLSLGTTNSVGVIVPFFTHPSFVERLRGWWDVLNETHWNMVLCSIEPVEQVELELELEVRGSTGPPKG